VGLVVRVDFDGDHHHLQGLRYLPSVHYKYLRHVSLGNMKDSPTQLIEAELNRSYIGIPIFILLFAVYKLRYKTRFIPPAEVDLVTGLQMINEEEQQYLEEQKAKGPLTWKQKIWESL
jgi:amino acid permease